MPAVVAFPALAGTARLDIELTNTLIGLVQELHVKWALDRLVILNAPSARVVRDGQIS